MTDITARPTDSRAKRNVAILVLAQAFLGAQMPMIFTIGGLAGQTLAPRMYSTGRILYGALARGAWILRDIGKGLSERCRAAARANSAETGRPRVRCRRDTRRTPACASWRPSC